MKPRRVKLKKCVVFCLYNQYISMVSINNIYPKYCLVCVCDNFVLVLMIVCTTTTINDDRQGKSIVYFSKKERKNERFPVNLHSRHTIHL